MRISVFGLGYVGVVSVACLARDGHRVVGVDIDPVKLELIRAGRSPIVEEGIQELMREVVQAGSVSVTDSVSDAIRDTELSFVCVGTPSSGNGSQDLSAVRRIGEQIGAALQLTDDYHTIVLRSTVEPGTVDGMFRETLERASGKKAGTDFGVCFQPEFLREGTSIRDYDSPPFTIVGAADERPAAVLRSIFGHLPCEFIHTSVREAELLKYACNAFHALKVTFANEIGRLAQSLGTDPHEVMRLVCKDTRLNISPAYLRPGFAFGGSCLPKDLRALTYLGKRGDVVTPMLSGILASNRVHIDHVIERVLRDGRRRVGMVGLSFKAGTDDLRESPLVTIAERFIGKGLQLRIYDPAVSLSRLIGANRRFIETIIPHIAQLMVTDISAAITDADIVIAGIGGASVCDGLAAHCREDQLLLDLVALPDRERFRARYEGACW
jgi:GDP-mannose 6-dehydrogenase